MNERMVDCLRVTISFMPNVEPHLLITRDIDEFSFEVVNEILDTEEALKIYDRLVGNT